MRPLALAVELAPSMRSAAATVRSLDFIGECLRMRCAIRCPGINERRQVRVPSSAARRDALGDMRTASSRGANAARIRARAYACNPQLHPHEPGIVLARLKLQ